MTPTLPRPSRTTIQGGCERYLRREHIMAKEVTEIESHITPTPNLTDGGPYRLMLADSGLQIFIESPFGGTKRDLGCGRAEIVIDVRDWPSIVATVEKLFAEQDKWNQERSHLDRMYHGDDRE